MGKGMWPSSTALNPPKYLYFRSIFVLSRPALFFCGIFAPLSLSPRLRRPPYIYINSFGSVFSRLLSLGDSSPFRLFSSLHFVSSDFSCTACFAFSQLFKITCPPAPAPKRKVSVNLNKNKLKKHKPLAPLSSALSHRGKSPIKTKPKSKQSQKICMTKQFHVKPSSS